MSKKKSFYTQGAVTHPEFATEPSVKGDGDPKCAICGGAGVVVSKYESDVPPEVVRCKCVRLVDVARRMNGGWAGLAGPKVKLLPGKSALTSRIGENLLVTSPVGYFRSHVRDVALRTMLTDNLWFFDVVTDAGLISAWLASIKLNNGEIYDGDVRTMLPRYADLESAALPPDLLIVYLGIKQAANKETSNVLFEVLQMRFAEGKSTWLFAQPHSPFNNNHLAWSHALWEHMFDIWDYDTVRLGEETTAASKPSFGPPPVVSVSPAEPPPPSSPRGKFMSAEELSSIANDDDTKTWKPKSKWRK